MFKTNMVFLLTLLAFTGSAQALNVKSSHKIFKTIVASKNQQKMTQAAKKALYIYLAHQTKMSPAAIEAIAECFKNDIEINYLELKKRLTK